MVNKSPFDLDEGIEDVPVVKAPAQAVKTVLGNAGKFAKQQTRALTNAFISQLYGSGSTSTTDNDQQQADSTAVDPLVQVKKTQTNTDAHTPPQAQQSSATSTNDTTTKTPEEEQKLEETRRKLKRQHVTEYYDVMFGRVNDVETDVKKEANRRKQAEQQRERDAEEEKRKKEQEMKEKNQRFVAPPGKGGRNKMRQPDIASARARIKTEVKTAGAG